MHSCTNILQKRDPAPSGLHFHNFPQNKHYCLLWKDACKIPTYFDTNGLKICSDHFEENDFQIPYDAPDNYLKTLKADAIPHRNLNTINVRDYSSIYEKEKRLVEENAALRLEWELLQKETSELQSKIAYMNLKRMKKAKATQRLRLRHDQLKRKCNVFPKKNLLMKTFSPAQIEMLLKKAKVTWSDDDLAMAFTLRHMSNKECYLYLKETLNIPLPSLSCVQKWAASL